MYSGNCFAIYIVKMLVKLFSRLGSKSLVATMSDQDDITLTREQEIDDILIDSSLYLGMSPADRQDLLHYLVLFYFTLLPEENRRALPVAMQTGSAM